MVLNKNVHIIVVITIYVIQALEWRLPCVFTIVKDFFFFETDSMAEISQSISPNRLDFICSYIKAVKKNPPFPDGQVV